MTAAPFGRRATIAWATLTAVVAIAIVVAASTAARSDDLGTAMSSTTIATLALAGQLVGSTLLVGRARVALRRRAGALR